MTVVDDNYTGHVEPRTAARRTLPGRLDRQGFGGPDGQQRLPGHVFPDRRDATHRRRQRRRDPARADRAVRPEAVADRHQPPASGPLAGAGRGGQGHRRADRRAPARRRARCRSNRTGSWPTATPSRSASCRFDVIHLQGHTPGSVALALDGADPDGATHLFTGDCLFPGGVGKTWQEGDFEQLLGDVTSRVFDVYGDSTVVYPGPRRRHHARRRAATPRRVERTRLVIGTDKTVAVVTGASRGAGLGIAHALGSHGCTVYVTGRTRRPASPRSRHDPRDRRAGDVGRRHRHRRPRRPRRRRTDQGAVRPGRSASRAGSTSW